MIPNKFTSRHITSKMSKSEDKIYFKKIAREKQLVTDKRCPIKLSVDFSKEALQARR